MQQCRAMKGKKRIDEERLELKGLAGTAVSEDSCATCNKQVDRFMMMAFLEASISN